MTTPFLSSTMAAEGAVREASGSYNGCPDTTRADESEPTIKVALGWIGYVGAAALISAALLMSGLNDFVTPAY